MSIRSIVLMIWVGAGFAPTPVQAGTVRVPSEQPSIQAAIDLAANGDTILVAEGVYRENISFAGKNLVIRSEHGPALTNLRPANVGAPMVDFVSGEPITATLTGFTLSHTNGAAAVRIENGSGTVRGNAFTHLVSGIGNGAAVFVRNNSPSIIDRNVFYDLPGAYAVIWADSDIPMTVTNNSINTGRIGLVLWSTGSTVKNNSVSKCLMGVSASAAQVRQYNNVWGNTSNWVSGSPDVTDISVDPQYLNPSAGDLRLNFGSQLIDAGDPSETFLDPDGTRNDIGALPFDQAGPIAFAMWVDTGDLAHVLTPSPAFSWRFYQVGNSQSGYEIEIGDDDDWSAAERWATGQVSSADTVVPYGGAALIPGEVYYWRLRVSNGSVWGGWKSQAFRINEQITSPVPAAPAGGAGVSLLAVILRATNTSSPFGDDLTYDFEVYADPGLTSLVASQSGIEEQSFETKSDKIFSLAGDTHYWWRCRAFDGFQYSEWSTAEEFVTRAPATVTVPADYATIQAGMDAATEGDTVLVAPGIYTGAGNWDLNFHGVNVVLLSVGGADVTVIDCGASAGNHRGLSAVSGEDTTSEVNGFTITNAASTGSYAEDAAVYMEGSGLTLKNCLITGNGGHGLQSSGNNYVPTATLQMKGCLVAQNARSGAALWRCDGVIDSSAFAQNGEDGLWLAGPTGIAVYHSLMEGNQRYGINIWVLGGPGLEIANNTMVGNLTGLYYYWEPPKMAPLDTDSLLNVVTANMMAYNAQYGVHEDGLGFGTALSCNNAYGNLGGDWHSYSVGPGDEHDNFTANPRFCDYEAGDYHVAPNSACAPTNNSCGLLVGAFDVDAQCTGACCTGLTGNVNGDYEETVNLTDLTVLINHLFVTFQPLACRAEANTSGDAACELNLTDLTALVNWLFVTFEPVAPCNSLCE